MTQHFGMTAGDKRMAALAWLLGAAHLVFGATKLAGLPTMLEQFAAWQLPPWMMTFVGVAQVLGGLGLFIRNLRLPSSFAMGLVMVGAVVTVLSSGHGTGMAPLCLLLAGLCFWVAFHRLKQFAREFVAQENAG